MGLEALRILIYDFLAAEEAIKASRYAQDFSEWVQSVVHKLKPSIQGYSKKQIDLAMALILYEQSLRDNAYDGLFCHFTEIYKERGGVF